MIPNIVFTIITAIRPPHQIIILENITQANCSVTGKHITVDSLSNYTLILLAAICSNLSCTIGLHRIQILHNKAKKFQWFLSSNFLTWIHICKFVHPGFSTSHLSVEKKRAHSKIHISIWCSHLCCNISASTVLSEACLSYFLKKIFQRQKVYTSCHHSPISHTVKNPDLLTMYS